MYNEWKAENRRLIWNSIWDGWEVRMIGLSLWTVFIILVT